MKPSDFQKIVQCRFESCLKKVVRHVVKDYQQGLKQRKDKEIPFCELPEIVVEKLAVRDEYDSDYTFFNVCGNDIRICDVGRILRTFKIKKNVEVTDNGKDNF